MRAITLVSLPQFHGLAGAQPSLQPPRVPELANVHVRHDCIVTHYVSHVKVSASVVPKSPDRAGNGLAWIKLRPGRKRRPGGKLDFNFELYPMPRGEGSPIFDERSFWRESLHIIFATNHEVYSTCSTAAPRMASFLSEFSARLASRSGNTSISVWIGISAARRRKSSPSWRVLLATLRRTRSW